MKKFLILLSTFLFVVFSCSIKEPDSKIVTENLMPNEYIDLLNDIKTYNSSQDIHVDTKGLFNWFKRHPSFTDADLTGFCMGTGAGLLCGAGAFSLVSGLILGGLFSIFALPADLTSSMIIPDTTNNLNIATCVYDNTSQIDVGAAHNYIITKLFLTDENFLHNWSEDDIIRFVIEETSKIFPDSVNINIENIHLEFDDEIAEIRANKATELYENLLINNPNDYDMQIINYYYASASSLPVSEVSEYTSSIEAIVENSNITDESKTKVNSAISLTESSIVLWQGL